MLVRNSWKLTALIIAAAMIVLSSFSASSLAAGGVCYSTTKVMKKACGSEITDDLYEEIAKCLNSDDYRGMQKRRNQRLR